MNNVIVINDIQPVNKAQKDMYRSRHRATVYASCRTGAIVPECIWCKQREKSVKALTVEHINGMISPFQISVSCKNCNKLHGKIIFAFANYLKGCWTINEYLGIMFNYSRHPKFAAIVYNRWFQESIAIFRHHEKFNQNPSNISVRRAA